jgi:hypothetical protein
VEQNASIDRVVHCLKVALQSKEEGEVSTSLNFARKFVRTNGLDVSRLCFDGLGTGVDAVTNDDKIAARSALRSVMEWREKLQAAETRIAELQTEVRDLRGALSSVDGVTSVDGKYGFAALRSEVVRRIGRDFGWQTIFAEATGTPLDKLQRWRERDQVPVEAIEAASNLTPPPRPTKDRWKAADYDKLCGLMAIGTYAMIAERMSEHFKRRVSENAIKGAIDRIRKNILLEQLKAGADPDDAAKAYRAKTGCGIAGRTVEIIWARMKEEGQG